MPDELFGANVVYRITRAQLIQDGELVDVSNAAKAAGFTIPVALTRAVWAKYVEFDAEALKGQGQSINGRLWDVLWMLRVAIQRTKGSQLEYQLYVALPHRGDWEPNEKPPEPGSGLSRETHRLVTLKAICDGGDNAEPVITILLPSED